MFEHRLVVSEIGMMMFEQRLYYTYMMKCHCLFINAYVFVRKQTCQNGFTYFVLLHYAQKDKQNNMDFKCSICKKDFDLLDGIFKHLKKEHKSLLNSQMVECVVNNSCSKKYSNFKSLRKHVNQCVKLELPKQLISHAPVTILANIF